MTIMCNTEFEMVFKEPNSSSANLPMHRLRTFDRWMSNTEWP